MVVVVCMAGIFVCLIGIVVFALVAAGAVDDDEGNPPGPTPGCAG